MGIILCKKTFAQKFKPQYIVSLDSTKGKYILSQCSRYTIDDYDKVFSLSNNDIRKLEKNFKSIYELKSNDTCFICSSWDKKRNLEEFAFQIVGVEIKGKRYIYINAFSIQEISDSIEPIFKQLKKPLVMCDGGAAFWGAYYEIKSNKFEQLNYNGSAPRHIE